MLREFASKRHVKLSRATIKAKDDVEEETKPAKPRRRRGNGGIAPEEEYSSRSLAKVVRPSPMHSPCYGISFAVCLYVHRIMISYPNCWLPASPVI